MNIKKSLLLFFFIYLGVRLFFSLQTPYFGDDYSYFAMRQVDHIRETGKPLIEDDLSFGGRTFNILPFYFYFLSLFTLFFPKIIIIKIINNVLASSIIFAMYFACEKTIKNRRISLICAVMAALMPIYIKETLHNISLLSVLIPGGILLYYLFLNFEKNVLDYAILLTVILILSSISSFMLILGIIVFIILNFLENKSISKIGLEFSSFFLIFFLWVMFIFLKDAFQLHGLEILNLNSQEINLLSVFTNIGLLPILLGSYTSYVYLFKKKSASTLLFISSALASLILLLSGLIREKMGVVFLGMSLVILFGQFFKDFITNLKKTRFSEQKLFTIIIAVIILFQLMPGALTLMRTKSFSEGYIDGFRWLEKNTEENSVVLSLPEKGHLITYFGERKNVMDTEYILRNDIKTRRDDIESFFSTRLKIPALRILEKYGVDYIIVSDDIDYLVLEDDCFSDKYYSDIIIYRKEHSCVLNEN